MHVFSFYIEIRNLGLACEEDIRCVLIALARRFICLADGKVRWVLVLCVGCSFHGGGLLVVMVVVLMRDSISLSSPFPFSKQTNRETRPWGPLGVSALCLQC